MDLSMIYDPRLLNTIRRMLNKPTNQLLDTALTLSRMNCNAGAIKQLGVLVTSFSTSTLALKQPTLALKQPYTATLQHLTLSSQKTTHTNTGTQQLILLSAPPPT